MITFDEVAVSLAAARENCLCNTEAVVGLLDENTNGVELRPVKNDSTKHNKRNIFLVTLII